MSLPATIEWEDWPELSYALGLTDGLPTFPPERRTVDALVAGTGRRGDEVVGAIPPANRSATVEAMLEPRFNLGGVQTTTHPCWPLVIVSGAAVGALDMASTESVFNGGG